MLRRSLLYALLLLTTFASLVEAQSCKIPPGFLPISTPSQLAAIDEKLDGKYVLCQDIDLTGSPLIGIGYRSPDPQGPFGQPTVKPFTGILDGNGYSIKNFTPPRPVTQSERPDGGLFAALHRATVRNLTITDSRVTGFEEVGVLAGRMSRSKILNVKVLSSTVTVPTYYGTFSHVGLLGGSCDASTIKDVALSGTVRGVQAVGSMCGTSSGIGIISKVVARGEVFGGNPADAALASHQQLGGLIGAAHDRLTLSDSGFEGTVASAVDQSSGFDGYTFYGGAIGNASFSERLLMKGVWFTGSISNMAAEFGMGPDWKVKSYTGGLFGHVNGKGEVSDSRVEAQVQGGQPGGIAGEATGAFIFRRVLTLGKVEQYPLFTERPQDIGGSFARSSGIRVDKVYFNATLNPALPINGANNGLDEAILRSRKTYSGWSMSSTTANQPTRWKIEDGLSFPTLRAIE